MVMGQTIARAASGESVDICGAEGFTISGKRTEDYDVSTDVVISFFAL